MRKLIWPKSWIEIMPNNLIEEFKNQKQIYSKGGKKNLMSLSDQLPWIKLIIVIHCKGNFSLHVAVYNWTNYSNGRASYLCLSLFGWAGWLMCLMWFIIISKKFPEMEAEVFQVMVFFLKDFKFSISVDKI